MFLDIVQLEENALDKYCCQDTLETLDLSNNQIIRLDTISLKNLGRLEQLNLHNNKLSLCEQNFKKLRNLKKLVKIILS